MSGMGLCPSGHGRSEATPLGSHQRSWYIGASNSSSVPWGPGSATKEMEDGHKVWLPSCSIQLGPGADLALQAPQCLEGTFLLQEKRRMKTRM